MRRSLVACALSLAAAGTGGASASSAATSSPPRAALQGFVCQRAANALDRGIEDIAVMRPMAGTQRMEMKFVLLRRTGFGAPFYPVQGGDLGRWRQPKPPSLGQRPSDVWRVKKLVVNLTAPAAYRFRVTFRWIGASGLPLGHAVLFSPLCYEPK
jgi:hypothetical protein